MPFEFLEEIALGDVAFRACGRTLEETFKSAWDAVLSLMIENPESIADRLTRSIQVEDRFEDLLLCKFLEELIYFKDAESLVLRLGSVKIGGIPPSHILRAKAKGEEIDPARHHLGLDVKAVTLHGLVVEKTPEGYCAQVVLDV